MNFPRVFGMILDIIPVHVSAETPMKSPSREPSLRRCSLAALEARITELAGQLNAATYRWLTLIAEFDRRKGWVDGSLHSCAHWLNFKVGLNLGAAREKVRVAHALPGLPKIASAMGRGELSYSKVRALTRVACPATEEALLMIALPGTAYHASRPERGCRRRRPRPRGWACCRGYSSPRTAAPSMAGASPAASHRLSAARSIAATGAA